SAANLATAVLDFVESLGLDGTPAAAGISLGGWTAIECARQGGARAAIGLCPAGFWREPLSPPDGRVARARRVGRLLAPALPVITLTAGGRRRALGRSFHRPELLSPKEAAAVTRAWVKSSAYPEANALMRAGTVTGLDAIKAPITLAWAEYDRL